MMGHRERLKSGDEWDVVSRSWRRLLCYMDKPGTARSIKRRLARRARHEARLEAVREASTTLHEDIRAALVSSDSMLERYASRRTTRHGEEVLPREEQPAWIRDLMVVRDRLGRLL